MTAIELIQRGGRFAARNWFASSRRLAIGAIALIHLAALAAMALTEAGWLGRLVFLLTWGALNGMAIALVRRPALAAALALFPVALVILLSMFKYSVLWMTLNFFDLLIIDPDTVVFLLTILPDLGVRLIIAAALGLPLAIVLWRIDPFRVRRSFAALGAGLCIACLVAVGGIVPEEPSDQFHGTNHVSLFVRSGVGAVSAVATYGWMDFDTVSPESLRAAMQQTCAPARKLPHIVMVLDESSFDIAAATGAKVPEGYAEHFKSFDGKTRALVVEGAGGPTWYTEYNVLTGLSVRSFGRFAYYVTRIAAGSIERGLPQSLRRCGYKTFTLYPASGAFLGARSFQSGVGIERLIDSQEMKSGAVQPDRFYYDQTLRLIGQQRGEQPLFLFTYLAANHFPWHTRYRPDLTPGWRDPGNEPNVDEYIRRQSMSAQDYKEFVARLKREYPEESFLIVRFGDHQPALTETLIDTGLDHAEFMRRIMAGDPRYFTTYYAIDAINFSPVDMSSADSPIDAAYLPLVVQEAAGVPLDPSFAEQKRIFERCQGQFWLCAGGSETRRFNRLLMDAGLIKGMVSR